MKIVVISDTHSYHRKIVIPEADILIHAGDITWKGELSIMNDFSDWLKELPHKNKCVIFGNHELGFRSGPKRKKAIELIEESGATYLEDSFTVIDGIKIYGSPWQPFFYNWEFNLQRGKDIAKQWSKIPDDIDVLITHGPPYGILDLVSNNIGRDPHQGCEELLKRVQLLKQLKMHAFGHLHMGYGAETVNDVKFVNAASCNDNYNPINPPIVIEV